MRSIIAFVAAMLFPASSLAGAISIDYGFGAENSILPNTEQKMINVAWDDGLWGPLHYKIQGGNYWDSGRDGLSSAYGFLGIGPHIEPAPWFWLSNYISVGGITKPDDLIGSHFQFALDLGAGFQMPSNKAGIGISFKHLSNAGVFKDVVNKGRNFWTIQVRLPI